MNTDTGNIRELAEGEKPKPNEVLISEGLQYRIGKACFEIIGVDIATNRIISRGIPRFEMTQNRQHRRKMEAELYRMMEGH